MTIKEFAARIGVDPSNVVRRAASGQIDSVMVGGRRYITSDPCQQLPPEGAIKLADYAQQVGLSASQVRRKARSGVLPAVKIGKDWWILPD